MNRLPNDVEFLNKIILAMENSFGIWKDILPSNLDELKKYFKELVEYKKLEEQDLLIKLPCKVGDTVFIYADFTKNLEPYTVEAIHLGSCYTMQFDCNLYMNDELIDSTEFELEELNKTVFLTREEAEKALSEDKQ